MIDLHRIQTHARSILEGEGQDEHSPALVEAVARAIREDALTFASHPVAYVYEDQNDLTGLLMDGYFDLHSFARAALSTIRKHQAGE